MKGPLVLLTTGLDRGGAEAQVVLLARALSERGWQVHVVSMLEPGAFQSDLAEAGITLHSLGMKPGRANPWGAARLAIILRSVRPMVLHCHMFHANLLGRLARLVFPVPTVISTLHSMAESSRHSADARWRDRIYGLTDSLAGHTVAVCDAVGARHVEAGAVSPRRLRVVPNGVDTRLFRPDDSRRSCLRRELGAGDDFIWLAAGRLMWKKDYPALLRAAARLPGCTLWIAGVGPLRDELHSLARDLAVTVRWLGARDDMPRLMNAADALVLSSVVEGLPMVLLEAAASGLPCVSTDVGGARGIIANSKTGFLTPRQDSDALAGAMARLAGMPVEARRDMGQAARLAVMKQFDLQAVASQWEQLYNER
jgi:glycosyltransferase involved in cell wall biosynthesis